MIPAKVNGVTVRGLMDTGSRWTLSTSSFNFLKKAISMERTPYTSVFGQTEMIPLVKARVQAQENEYVVEVIPNLACDLVIAEGWTLLKRFREQANPMGITTRAQSKAKVRVELIQ